MYCVNLLLCKSYAKMQRNFFAFSVWLAYQWIQRILLLVQLFWNCPFWFWLSQVRLLEDPCFSYKTRVNQSPRSLKKVLCELDETLAHKNILKLWPNRPGKNSCPMSTILTAWWQEKSRWDKNVPCNAALNLPASPSSKPLSNLTGPGRKY